LTLFFLTLLIPIKLFACDIKLNCFKKFNVSLYNSGFFYSSEKNEGVDKDIINEIMKRNKCQYDISVMPRIRIWKSLENGSLDLSTSGIQNKERDKFAFFINYIKLKNYIILKKELNFHSWQEFLNNKNLKIGVIRGFKHGEADKWLEILNKENRVIENVDHNALYDSFINHKFDVTIGHPMTFQFYFKNINGLSNLVNVEDWNIDELPIKHGIILSKKVFSPEEYEKWKNIVNDIISDGTMFKILKKYFSAKEAREIVIEKN
ncbi:MAG: transporter substrate-binding domain-containing protein, partial [Silvanigrellaceae bacterium]|nr:transporter substrate-binding domain-containing protein [Silvanigrellaceae bacterium]